MKQEKAVIGIIARVVTNMEETNEGTNYYYYMRGLKQSLVGAKTLQKIKIQQTI